MFSSNSPSIAGNFLFQIIFYHHLKLFSTDPEVVSGKKPLINECYDELVRISFDSLLEKKSDRFSFEIFQEPSESFARILNVAKVETSVPSAIEQECRYFLVVVRW